MHLDTLCRHIEDEFRVSDFTESWPLLQGDVPSLTRYADETFLRRGNGLLVRGRDSVAEVYTTVFPNEAVLDHFLARALPGSVLISHHALMLDGRKGSLPLTDDAMEQFWDRQASLYVLHTPLDYGSRLSTWRSLARTLGVQIEGTFEHDGKMGCFGPVDVPDEIESVFTFQSMVLRVEERLELTNTQIVEHVERAVGRVALLPGDGASPALLDAADVLGCHTYITGILDNPVAQAEARSRSQQFLIHAEQRAINLIGASQYATQAPALRVLATWFQALGLTAHFIADKPELPEFLAG